MALRLELDGSPMRAGETRPLIWRGAGEARVQIKCWVFRPPPKRFVPCPSCGAFVIFTNEKLDVTADYQVFAPYGGILDVNVFGEATNESKRFKIEVMPDSSRF